jgi:excisionase family DNA binding protein
VRELARLMPDRQIARLLNRSGIQTGYGNGWTLGRVCGFRNHHNIAGYRDGEWAERGEITLDAAAEIIGVCKMTALRMLRRGDIKGRQVCAGAPWVIKEEDVTAFAARKQSAAAVTPNPAQATLEFQ